MKEPVNIKAVTDTVFTLCEKLYAQVDGYSAAHADMFHFQDASDMEQKELALMKAFGHITQPLLAAQLKAAVPEAAFWWKGESKPGSEYVWVVSPAVYRFMHCAYTAIALMQHDELLLGLHLNYLASTITTGERGDGAATFQEIHKVNERELSTDASYLIHHAKEVKLFPEMAQYKRYQKFTESVSSRPAYNNVVENLSSSMIGVASNHLDFVMGSSFDFIDVAAAVGIVESAGGVVTDFSGTKEKLFSGAELFCSNRKIHEQFMKTR